MDKFLNIFRVPDLRKRVLFTLGLLAIYRLGAQIPTPGVDGYWIHPVNGKLHVHTGEQVCETVLLR